MNFITMLCLALANCEQFMSLSKAEDHGVSARSDLAEIDDLNLTAPSPLQRLLSSDDDDEEEEEDEADEDEENEEADESEVEDGKNVWSNPQVGVAAGVVGLAVGIAGVYLGQYAFGTKPAEATVKLTVEEGLIDEFKKGITDQFVKQTANTADKTFEVEVKLQQFIEIPVVKAAVAAELKKKGTKFTTGTAEPTDPTAPDALTVPEEENKKKTAPDALTVPEEENKKKAPKPAAPVGTVPVKGA